MFKRGLDVSLACAGLLVLAPLIAVLAALVFSSMGRPILFAQQRPGKHQRLFTLYKFRTMCSTVGAGGEPLPDADRLTPLGRFLRRYSLDELPQLWNVLRGDMSLVGPRPLLVEYLPLYSAEQARRHEVRPGITGWAQVNGRNAQSWDERLRLDVWYVDHRSFWLDFTDTVAHAAESPQPRRRQPARPRHHAALHRTTAASPTIDKRPALVLVGASGHAKVVIDIIEQQGSYWIAHLLDDNAGLQGKSFSAIRCWARRADLPALPTERLLPRHRHHRRQRGTCRIAAPVAPEWLRNSPARFTRAPASAAGRRSDRAASSWPGASSTRRSVGGNVIINTGATVDHDCRIEDAVHIAPGCHLCGGVSVGAGQLARRRCGADPGREHRRQGSSSAPAPRVISTTSPTARRSPGRRRGLWIEHEPRTAPCDPVQRLALEGGDARAHAPFAPWPVFAADEIEAVPRVLRSGKVNYWTGEESRDSSASSPSSVGVSSRGGPGQRHGGAGARPACAGHRPGRRSGRSEPTFIASASCVVRVGATPVCRRCRSRTARTSRRQTIAPC